MDETCFVCGGALDDKHRLVLVLGKIHQVHCSDFCLRENIRKRRVARALAERRWLLGSLLIVGLAVGINTLWHRYRAPRPEWISSGPLDPVVTQEEEPPGPIFFGPAWPPTDDDWIIAFARATWIFPLPGPVRRDLTIDGRIFGPAPPVNHPARCRTEGHCGVDLGGELWGEHILAAQDGVIDRVQAGGEDERGGQYVRLSHFGGMVFTQYFHLAGTPRTIVRGARVKAGDVIGLLGDSGLSGKGSRRHLHFALSVRPSPAFPEVYWDPQPLMADWPLRLPAHGTVAGLTPPEKEPKAPPRRRTR